MTHLSLAAAVRRSDGRSRNSFEDLLLSSAQGYGGGVTQFYEVMAAVTDPN